jgi:hypothetical protein
MRIAWEAGSNKDDVWGSVSRGRAGDIGSHEPAKVDQPGPDGRNYPRPLVPKHEDC